MWLILTRELEIHHPIFSPNIHATDSVASQASFSLKNPPQKCFPKLWRLASWSRADHHVVQVSRAAGRSTDTWHAAAVCHHWYFAPSDGERPPAVCLLSRHRGWGAVNHTFLVGLRTQDVQSLVDNLNPTPRFWILFAVCNELCAYNPALNLTQFTLLPFLNFPGCMQYALHHLNFIADPELLSHVFSCIM